MSLGDLLPLQFYEIAFLCTLLFVPVVSFRGDLENYFFGVLVIYMLLRVIRNRKKSKLPADGKAVFISGCDSGFGHMVAEKMDKEGYVVFAGCLNESGDGANNLKKKCSDKLHIIALDVTDEKSVSSAGNYVREHLENLELWALFNNAGVYGHGDVEMCPVETFKFLADVNLFGMVRLTQEFLPLIRKSQGRVVNMSSINGRFTWPCAAAYNASKYGIECVSDSLRMEMRKFGVKVAIIEPAMFGGNTDIHSEQNIARHYKQINEVWASKTEEVKSVYSKKYLKHQIDTIAQLRQKLAAKSPDGVIDAVVDAITSSAPECRYAVHGGPFPVDLIVVLATVYPYLPETLTDWFLCRVTGHLNKDILQDSSPEPAAQNGIKSE
ncbi:retinol dehydrogenase 16-like isoform X2 [Mercenaria mercenaria]|nr:retinol dehydrogenase 16-like isoform X2 [Mercenaria mercenaria]XP_045187223.1 retinol dehydrogenase 16-like isoform X2 [Mercenaria mercenaria]